MTEKKDGLQALHDRLEDKVASERVQDKYGLGRAVSSISKAFVIVALCGMVGFCDEISSRIEHGPVPSSAQGPQ